MVVISKNVKVRNILKLKYLILFTLFTTNLIDQPTPEIRIEQGTLTGKVNQDGTILEYLGIPYAVTTSHTRFQAPIPAPQWNGVLKATEESDWCLQKTFFMVTGAEDCLKMNIYVPTNREGPLPVMVYIHGGGFITGSGSKLAYGPEFLVKHNVILVTFNYRLGPLGFICLNIKEAPGNAGLRDQLEALRWVNRNIAAFGGDPDNVTLFGESAGAVSVSLLSAIEASDGLFHRAIMQSGSSFSSWAINRRPIWSASLLANELGYVTEDPYQLYKIFTNVSYKELVNAAVDKPLGKYFETKLIYLPCIEKEFPGVEPLLTDIPYNLLKKKTKNIPIIHGTTSAEGLFFIRFDNETTLFKKNERYLFATDLKFISEKDAEITANKVKKFYFGEDVISLKTIMNISEYYTHVFFEMPSILESEMYLQKSKSHVFNYYFNYSGGRNVMKLLLGFRNHSGASHGDEILYLFNGKFWPFWINKYDQNVIDYMTKAWTNFAKYGHPSPSPEGDLPVHWNPSTRGNLRFLHIQDEIQMGAMPNPNAYDVWKDIYTKYRKKQVPSDID